MLMVKRVLSYVDIPMNKIEQQWSAVKCPPCVLSLKSLQMKGSLASLAEHEQMLGLIWILLEHSGISTSLTSNHQCMETNSSL